MTRRRLVGAALAAGLLLPAPAAAGPAAAAGATVATYHGDIARSGHFVVPGLSWARAPLLHLDPAFAPRFSGHLYAQPLFWRPPGAGAGMLVVATESDTVAAIDAASGRILWQRVLGVPVPRAALPCGNIDPLGITGTPVIDRARAAVYVDAVDGSGGRVRHLVWGLALGDGATLPGWPVDVAAALAARGERFIARDQNQRGALALFDGRVYVPYGGHFGDCGDYRGWVVGIAEDNPRDIASWHTQARGGGVWAPGGVAGDGRALFVATGNTIGARGWGGGEAVIRLPPDLHGGARRRDFFAPADWRALDARDLDLGGANPLPLDLPAAGGGRQALVLALGKDRRAYLLDRDDLGGIGGALAVATVARRPIITAPAAYPAGDGVFVAFGGYGRDCPAAGAGGALGVLKITAGTPTAIATAWCGAVRGRGAPIVTTATASGAEPIVWILGAEGDGRLHGYRGDDGAPLYTSAPLAGLRHFQTLIATPGRLYVGADDRLYAFAY
jgi:hypothetical protein